jgi:hypothetical protein
MIILARNIKWFQINEIDYNNKNCQKLHKIQQITIIFIDIDQNLYLKVIFQKNHRMKIPNVI